MKIPSLNTIKIKSFIANFMIPLIALGIIAGMFFLIIFPSLSEIPTLKEDLKQKQIKADNLQQKYIKLNNLLDFKSSVEENRDLVSSVLVEEPLVPQLLTQIDIIAREAGLVVMKMSYSISDVEEIEGGSSSTVSVRLGVSGTYDQVVTFLRSLESAGRVVDVANVRYSYDEESGSINTTFILLSPYVELDTQAVTDDPITFDISDAKFQDLMSKLKALRIYEVSIHEVIDIEELEEEVITLEEVPVPEGEGEPSIFAPVPPPPEPEVPTEQIPPAAE